MAAAAAAAATATSFSIKIIKKNQFQTHFPISNSKFQIPNSKIQFHFKVNQLIESWTVTSTGRGAPAATPAPRSGRWGHYDGAATRPKPMRTGSTEIESGAGRLSVRAGHRWRWRRPSLFPRPDNTLPHIQNELNSWKYSNPFSAFPTGWQKRYL